MQRRVVVRGCIYVTSQSFMQRRVVDIESDLFHSQTCFFTCRTGSGNETMTELEATIVGVTELSKSFLCIQSQQSQTYFCEYLTGYRYNR